MGVPVARAQQTVFEEARELGASSGTTGGAVVSVSGTKNVVDGIRAGRSGRSGEFDMVDYLAIDAGDPFFG